MIGRAATSVYVSPPDIAAPSENRRYPIGRNVDSYCACATCVGMALGRQLYLGDNLDILRDPERIPADSVDLVYLDPPFNSQRDYNMLFEEHDQSASKAQLRAFGDSWRWDRAAQETYETMTGPDAPTAMANIVGAFCRAFPHSDMAAYLVMMAVRLIELHRVLKSTGSLYLHCDATASHYLKILLDVIFGQKNFRNEIIWKRQTSSGYKGSSSFGRNHDTLLFYSKSAHYTYRNIYKPYSEEYLTKQYNKIDEKGRRYRTHWVGTKTTPKTIAKYLKTGRIVRRADGSLEKRLYLDEQPGIAVDSIWTDIGALTHAGAERLGYPTQKPLALLERILTASSNEGDLVLDPFCGCGTTIHAAERLNRRWVGIDLTILAIRVIEKRLGESFPGLKYEFDGLPKDAEGAIALAERSTHNFQEWAVAVLGGQQTGGRRPKAGADCGIDGLLRFATAPGRTETAIIQVKGGKTVGPTAVRDLLGTMTAERAAIGILFTAHPTTDAMKRAAVAAESVAFEGWNRRYPKVQLISAAEWFGGKRPELPGQVLAPPAIEPPGSRPGENLVLPGVEAPPMPDRKATIVQLDPVVSVAAKDEPRGELKRFARLSKKTKRSKG